MFSLAVSLCFSPIYFSCLPETWKCGNAGEDNVWIYSFRVNFSFFFQSFDTSLLTSRCIPMPTWGSSQCKDGCVDRVTKRRRPWWIAPSDTLKFSRCHRRRRNVMNAPSCRRRKCSHRLLQHIGRHLTQMCFDDGSSFFPTHRCVSVLFCFFSPFLNMPRTFWTNRFKISSNHSRVWRQKMERRRVLSSSAREQRSTRVHKTHVVLTKTSLGIKRSHLTPPVVVTTASGR